MNALLKSAQEFEKDFTDAMGTLHVLAAKHNLPVPQLVFGPEWRAPIRSMSLMQRQLTISDGEFMGIGIQFGKFETAKVLYPA
jgi:hypothetical protein